MRQLLIRLNVVAFALAALPIAALGQEVRPLERTPPRPPTTEPQGFFAEPDLVQRAAIFFDRRLGNANLVEGWYYGPGDLIPGAGWASVGVRHRRWYADDSAVSEVSGAISWRGYKAAQAGVEWPALANSRFIVGSQIRVQDFPDIAHFGEGAGSLESQRAEYGLKSLDLAGYATYRPARWLGIGGSVGWLNPSIESGTAALDVDAPAFIHSEASITADTRDFAGHPTRGGLYKVSAANFSDRDSGVFTFRRYQAEAAQFLPLADSRLVFAVHGWLVGSDAGEGKTVPFYLQPSLGGHNSLRGYDDYRFHGQHMLLVNLEARVAAMTHVDFAAFLDAGNVAARTRDLNLDKRSVGVGLRLHSRRQTFMRVDAARSDEGWRVLLRLDDPLNLARLARRSVSVPFVH